jgi:hypothetical protein
MSAPQGVRAKGYHSSQPIGGAYSIYTKGNKAHKGDEWITHLHTSIPLYTKWMSAPKNFTKGFSNKRY